MDISVKNVEIAKTNLEATDLFSSINGVVVGIDQCYSGDNITPGGFAVTIVDPTSFYFQAELPEENLSQIQIGQTAKITLKAYPEKILEGKVYLLSFSPVKENIYTLFVSLSLPDPSNLRLSLSGTATIT